MQCLLALNPVRHALRECAPQLRAAAAAARAHPPARNTTPDGTVSAALADACDHVWGGGKGPYDPSALREIVGEKSPGHDLRPKHPHCAARAAGMLLDHLVADVRSARAGTAWLQRWTAHASAHEYYTRRCVGRECIAAGAPGACTAGCVAGSPCGLSIPPSTSPLAHTPPSPPPPCGGGLGGSGHAAPVYGRLPTVSGPSF